MSWLLLALQVILSAVFLVAATKKTLRSEQFFVTLRLSHQPAGSIMPIGVAVLALELTLALALLLAPARNAIAGLRSSGWSFHASVVPAARSLCNLCILCSLCILRPLRQRVGTCSVRSAAGKDEDEAAGDDPWPPLREPVAFTSPSDPWNAGPIGSTP